jgi:undecaprenyl diphosphate synthase
MPTTSDVIPNHVAVIMDGNGRWAKARFLPRIEGHRAGAKSVRTLLESALKRGVKFVTVYAFSSENWNRPGDEVQNLMKLFGYYLQNELALFHKHKVRLRAIGDRTKLTDELNQLLLKAESETAHYDSMQFIMAVSYGARDEIVSAAKVIANRCLSGEITTAQINEKLFANSLYAPDVPEVDLLIRTSNEFRVSNFLLWQIAYAEIVVSPVFWPEFNDEQFEKCLIEYRQRIRKFGLTQEQIDLKTTLNSNLS